MKYLKMLILLLSFMFVFYLANNQPSDLISYYSSLEEYYVDSSNQEIRVPIFICGNDCIFKSSLPNYYLEAGDALYKIKKTKLEKANSAKAFNQEINCYYISFNLELESNRIYDDVFLKVELPEKSLCLQIGSIITNENLEIMNLKLNENDEGIFVSDTFYKVKKDLSFIKTYHDDENTKTYFVPKEKRIYYYFTFDENTSKMGVIENMNYKILDLNLQEGYYA